MNDIDMITHIRSSSPHRLIISSPHHLIASSPHRLIASPSHRLTVSSPHRLHRLHRLITSSPHRLHRLHRLIASSSHRLIASSPHRLIVFHVIKTKRVPTMAPFKQYYCIYEKDGYLIDIRSMTILLSLAACRPYTVSRTAVVEKLWLTWPSGTRWMVRPGLLPLI